MMTTVFGTLHQGTAAADGRLEPPQAIPARYQARARAERVIAIARALLAIFTLLAGWLDPFTPAAHVREAYGLLIVYAGYAVALIPLAWGGRYPKRVALAMHGVDLLVFPALLFLTEGFASPLFVFLTFALVAAGLRWQSRGVLWTAALALAGFNLVGVYWLLSSDDLDLALNRLIIRNVYIVVVAMLLTLMGQYHEQARLEMARLAGWPRPTVDREGRWRSTILAYAMDVMSVPGALLVWEDGEEPWRHFIRIDRTAAVWREAPGASDPVAALALANRPFICEGTGGRGGSLMVRTADRSWMTAHDPIDPRLRHLLGDTAVIHIPLRGARTEGRLFALGRSGATADDLALGEVVAHRLAACLDESVIDRQARAAVLADERLQLAGELHDGVVQTLVGLSLQLEALRRAPADDLDQHISRAEASIAEEQRELRLILDELRAEGPDPASPFSLEHRLMHLAARIAGVWPLEIELDVSEATAATPFVLGREIYLMIREGLINVARHAGATRARVIIRANARMVRVTVSDNGHGFAFQGRQDATALAAQGLAPMALRDRVLRNSGSMVVESGPSGARLEISLSLGA